MGMGGVDMELLIKNARIVDYDKDFYGDIYIKNGKIEKIGNDLCNKCRDIDGEGLVVLPSFIDLHAHFRDPGYSYKEDLKTGSMAALKGGYTLVNLMANTKPICSNMDVVEYVLNKNRKIGLIDVHQTVSITQDFDGRTIDHIDSLDSRVKFLSDDGVGVDDSEVAYRAMKKAKKKGLILLCHEEDRGLSSYDMRLSENLMTIRDIYLAKSLNSRIHFCHVSTKEAMEEIIRAKKDNINITCEVTPHHMALYDNDYKVNPPIRTKKDVDYLIKAIQMGYVDAIATDHAPHTEEDKRNGACGISGLETAFSICYTVLVRGGYIDLCGLSRMMSKMPGELFQVQKGAIEKGYDADLAIVDLNKKIVVNSDGFLSKGKNTPFNGMEYYGEVVYTIKNGEILYDREGGVNFDNR